ncbi:hypothetical protein [Romboutsia sp.]|uniref:hypothetical protein n=1 Tax=Romboutsia sp. TaxID=1965302 RepID=UPI003F3F6CAD
MTSNEYNKDYYETSHLSLPKKNIDNNTIVKTGLVAGCAIIAANLVCPTVRKVTVPTCNFFAKQQIKLLAGIGILFTATYITSQDKNVQQSNNTET